MDIKQSPLRQVALKFSILNSSDQAWILSRLDIEERAALEALHQELEETGLLENPDVIQSLLGQISFKSAIQKDKDQFQQVVTSEHMLWSFILLDDQREQKKRDQILEALTESQREEFNAITALLPTGKAPEALKRTLSHYLSDGVIK